MLIIDNHLETSLLPACESHHFHTFSIWSCKVFSLGNNLVDQWCLFYKKLLQIGHGIEWVLENQCRMFHWKPWSNSPMRLINWLSYNFYTMSYCVFSYVPFCGLNCTELYHCICSHFLQFRPYLSDTFFFLINLTFGQYECTYLYMHLHIRGQVLHLNRTLME